MSENPRTLIWRSYSLRFLVKKLSGHVREAMIWLAWEVGGGQGNRLQKRACVGLYGLLEVFKVLVFHRESEREATRASGEEQKALKVVI